MEIIFSVIIALIADQFDDASGWVAYRFVSWAAYHKYVPRDRAEIREEEFYYYIDKTPGQLLKFFVGSYFLGWAFVTLKVIPAAAEPVVDWLPVPLAIRPLTVTVSRHDASCSMHPNSQAARQTWYYLKNEIEDMTSVICVASRSWRRTIRRLRKITGDERWDTIMTNLEVLYEIRDSSQSSAIVAPTVAASYDAGWVYCGSVISDSTVVDYQCAARTIRDDISRLVSDFFGRIETE